MIRSKVSGSESILGKSVAIERLRAIVTQCANSNAPVLLRGQSGTGKELVSRALHDGSQRASHPFVAINCGAIPDQLLESELFGHRKGSFTGATCDRKGRFELAQMGTLFLDEIGDMSLSAQAKVLRALQESKVQRVGSDKDIKVDVRIVAATNKDLRKEISEGNFREDLYHRLAVILIDVPALNNRREDIPLLINYFSKKIASEHGTGQKLFSDAAITLLQAYDWTGNVRELRNVIERLIILGSEQVTEKDVQLFASK